MSLACVTKKGWQVVHLGVSHALVILWRTGLESAMGGLDVAVAHMYAWWWRRWQIGWDSRLVTVQASQSAGTRF